MKKEFEKEMEILRSENQRLRGAYESMEIERNKWRVHFYLSQLIFDIKFLQEISELDGPKTNGLASRISTLETENEDLRRSVF